MKTYTQTIIERTLRRVRPGREGRADAAAVGGDSRGTIGMVRARWYEYSGSTATAHKAFLFGISSHGLGDGELL
jgi:ribosomal protein S5